MKTTVSKRAKTARQRYTVGRRGFAKISAVEGIHMSDEMAQDFQEFDRDAVSPEDRRRLLAEKYTRAR